MEKITETLITSDKARMEIFPKHCGHKFGEIENLIYTIADRFSKDYNGGFWEFVELSNNGFYIKPSAEKNYNIINHFGTENSGNNRFFGIYVTLTALEYKLHNTENADEFDLLNEKFNALYDLIYQDENAKEFFKLLD